MAVRDLVVRPGDRVSLAGRYVARDDGDWLDLARMSNLTFHPPDWMSHRSIRVVGLDPAEVPTDFGPNNDIIQGWARVTGLWRDDLIIVDAQADFPRPELPGFPRLACPPPLGGWDRGDESMEVGGLEDLRASGAIVVDEWLREPGGALVLRVAAQDVTLVRKVIGPQLQRRLCVVASRYTAQDYHRAVEAFYANWSTWHFESGSRGLDAEGQPFIRAEFLRVTDDIADWAESLPNGLLRLEPIMIPA